MLNPNGGVPLTLTDLVYMQSATFDAFKSLLNAFSNGTGNVRLAGCVVSWADTSRAAKKVSWTAGYVGLHGEVFPVAARSLDSVEDGTALYWKIIRVQEAQVTLQNGQQEARRERSYATLVPESLKDDASVKDAELKGLSDYVKGIINPMETVYNTSSSVDGVPLPLIRKDRYGDGLEKMVFVASLDKSVSLDNGLLCSVDDLSSNTFIPAAIFSLEKFIRPCMVVVRNNKIYLFDMAGSPLTSLPQCTIYSL